MSGGKPSKLFQACVGCGTILAVVVPPLGFLLTRQWWFVWVFGAVADLALFGVLGNRAISGGRKNWSAAAFRVVHGLAGLGFVVWGWQSLPQYRLVLCLVSALALEFFGQGLFLATSDLVGHRALVRLAYAAVGLALASVGGFLLSISQSYLALQLVFCLGAQWYFNRAIGITRNLARIEEAPPTTIWGLFFAAFCLWMLLTPIVLYFEVRSQVVPYAIALFAFYTLAFVWGRSSRVIAKQTVRLVRLEMQSLPWFHGQGFLSANL